MFKLPLETSKVSSKNVIVTTEEQCPSQSQSQLFVLCLLIIYTCFLSDINTCFWVKGLSMSYWLLTEVQKRMSWLEKNENSRQQILVNDILFDVVRVMFHTECQQFYDERQQLCDLVVIYNQDRKQPVNKYSWIKGLSLVNNAM